MLPATRAQISTDLAWLDGSCFPKKDMTSAHEQALSEGSNALNLERKAYSTQIYTNRNVSLFCIGFPFSNK